MLQPISFTLILIRVDRGVAVDTSVTQASTLQFTSVQKPIALRVRSGLSRSDGGSRGDASQQDLSGRQSGADKDIDVGDAELEHRGWKDGRLDAIV